MLRKSAGYSEGVCRSIENRRQEKRRMGLPELGFHAGHPEDYGDVDAVRIFAEAARKTDPELRRQVTERILKGG